MFKRLTTVASLLAIGLTGLTPAVADAAGPSDAPAATSTSTALTSATSDAPAARKSGKPWLSGVFAHSDKDARAFEKMRGSKVDFVSVHPERSSFARMMDPWWLDQTAGIRAGGARLEVSVPTWPGDSDVNTSAKAQWRAFGRLLVQRGEGDAIIVIGKEFNLNNGWHITPGNKAAWRQRFREAATALRSVPGNSFRIAWTPNEGPSQTGIAPTAAWPGKKYVDIVAPDYYDQWDAIHNAQQAKSRFNRKFGIEWWFKWAKKRGMKVGVSEWGVSSGSQWAGHTGGDNPYYIRAMHSLFKRYSKRLAYESYFEEPAGYVASSLVHQNPRARAAYRSLW